VANPAALRFLSRAKAPSRKEIVSGSCLSAVGLCVSASLQPVPQNYGENYFFPVDQADLNPIAPSSAVPVLQNCGIFLALRRQAAKEGNLGF